jgi:hypothetical protein
VEPMVARCIAGFYSHQFVLFSFIGRLLSTSEEQSEVFFSTSFKFNLRTRKLKEQKEKKTHLSITASLNYLAKRTENIETLVFSVKKNRQPSCLFLLF